MEVYQRIRRRLVPDASFHQDRSADLLGPVVHPGVRWLETGAGTRLHYAWTGPSNEGLANVADILVRCDLLANHLRRNPYVTAGIVARVERLPAGAGSFDLVTPNVFAGTFGGDGAGGPARRASA